jgi:hypothetical protein
MATWATNDKDNHIVWSFEDGKLDFDSWIKADAAREKKWEEGCAEHHKWRQENPGVDPSTHAGVCGELNSEWVAYANATPVK